MRYITILILSALLSSISLSAHALEKRKFCVFDIIGANGDIYNIMKDYKTAAVAWGVDVELKPFTDEKIAAEDLKAGQCDAAVLTGMSGSDALRGVLASLDSKQQALVLGHAVPMPVVIRTREYGEEFYKAMGSLDGLPEVERRQKAEEEAAVLYGEGE